MPDTPVNSEQVTPKSKKKRSSWNSEYKPEYAEQAALLCELGAINSDLARFFKVTRQTIDNWIVRHEKFSKAIKEAKEVADAKVVKSLFVRACGYSHDAVKIFNDNGIAMKVPYVEHYPPDTVACIFWLKNRRPAEWRDRVEQVIEGNIQVDQKLITAAQELAKTYDRN